MWVTLAGCTVWYMRYSSTIFLPVDPAVAYDVIADVRRWPDWLDTVEELTPLEEDADPIVVGRQVRIRQPKLPAAVWTVTEVFAGHHFTWENRAPGLRIVGTHVAEVADGGCVVTLAIDQQGPMRGLARLLWGRLTQEYVEREGRCLKTEVARRAERA